MACTCDFFLVCNCGSLVGLFFEGCDLLRQCSDLFGKFVVCCRARLARFPTCIAVAMPGQTGKTASIAVPDLPIAFSLALACAAALCWPYHVW